jgi:phosphatidylglycerophosphate synthase
MTPHTNVRCPRCASSATPVTADAPLRPPAPPDRPTHARYPRTAGERWTHDELERLRAARFSPPAVVAFLAASHRRAGEARAQRPDVARQAHAWRAAGAGAWGCLALGRVEPFRRRLAGGLAWWLLAGLMLDWHLGMLETANGRPRRLGPADGLTLVRAWLVPVIADEPRAGPLLLPAATDALDGVAARAGAPTRAGRWFDGVVDGAVLVAALAAARRHRRLGRATVALECARLAAGAAYATRAYFATATPPATWLTRSGRAATPVRMAALVSASLGRRRTGSTLLALATLASLTLNADAWLRERAAC